VTDTSKDRANIITVALRLEDVPGSIADMYCGLADVIAEEASAVPDGMTAQEALLTIADIIRTRAQTLREAHP
jgi:hypothetical protein